MVKRRCTVEIQNILNTSLWWYR